eukprot:CAMPEP_0182928404 /NCGR_PEP_ID=MMETSP0105_2-20130417/15568_1 /TAXON_ID=81532 ORGANISM="Acanthoeca-like sp., Strain 10tr" /NCGR_SAMPLE_ID=MMETSP0105_2 /ASSEMBLY_ACC=CAM_ASM_000205 /LENGTH=645 /DNA_ID=CAMNT_0025066407 /DNA_START=9 /DNA_END=1946 /DNA_ORIENTATION=+
MALWAQAVAMAACTAVVPGTVATSLPVEVTVDATAAGLAPFEHTWKRSWGSGHAALTLREDWRNHLKLAVKDLGLQGVRYHGLFDDDQGPVVPSPGVYNFTLLDSTWDFLISAGVKPIVELSFMPAVLAGCSWTGKVGGPTSSSPTITVNPSAAPCKAHTFHYNGVSQPPAGDNYDGWYDLVKATVEHAVERYTLAEVRTWSFEVWNELWGMPFPTEYMKLYNSSALAVKAVDSQLKVGGPATAGLDDVPQFVEECKKMNLPFDFVSTHHYPSDPACPRGDNWDPTCFTRDVRAARNSVAGYPFFLTEYNVGCCLGYNQHDTPAAAPFIFRQVGELSQELDVMSYWTFTDVFEEGGFPDTEYKNIYGSMTKDGVPKPAWRAFQLLHMHAGDHRASTTVKQPSKVTWTPPAEATVGSTAACALVPNTDFEGGDILPDSQPLVLDSAAECCAACQNHSGTSPETRCQAWSWGSAESKCCSKRCYLKQLGAASHAHHDGTFTSGYVGPAPPPPPPPGPKPQVSAFATVNGTADGTESLRVFAGFWGNPDQDETNPPANRSVTFTINHASGSAPSRDVTLYQIGAGECDPRAAWEAMGSPANPDAKQLAALMAASEIGTGKAVATPTSPTTTTVQLEMAENTAYVLAFA